MLITVTSLARIVKYVSCIRIINMDAEVIDQFKLKYLHHLYFMYKDSLAN